MGAIAAGVIAMIGTAIMLAVITGGVGGVINGRLRGNLLLGIVLVGLVYVCASFLIGFWPVAIVGSLPLVLTFILSSITVKYLEENKELHPVLSIITGLGIPLVIGASCIWLVRTRLFPFESSPWIAAGIFSCLVLYYTWTSKCTWR